MIGVGRNAERCAAAERELAALGEAELLRGDLSRMREVDRVASEIAARVDRIDVLVNNAGGMTSELVVTDEGLDENFASNHLGPFRLTERLRPLLEHAAADAPSGTVRIVNTSSDASEYVPELPWDDLQMLGDYDFGRAYCNGKLANVMFARALARRLGPDGIVAHAVHPGAVDTNFASYTPESVQQHMASRDLLTPEQGADTLVWAATSEEAGRANGAYYFERAEREMNPIALDDEAVERLWRESERLVTEARARGDASR